jgi:4-hydroxy-4-methyl-2-oxoglutarate aldolase
VTPFVTPFVTAEDEMTGFAAVPTTTLADLLGFGQVLDPGIRSLYPSSARLAGPAFTVRCPRGDNLMLHAAIYRAPAGAVIVVESGDTEYALAGGNVCAVAQRHGVAGFVLDGTIRDVGEARSMGFPVYGRGVVPIPGTKKAVAPLGEPVSCGGVTVHSGDTVVADEDGVLVVPAARAAEVLAAARAKLAAEAAETLDQWEAAHRAKIDKALAGGGFTG